MRDFNLRETEINQHYWSFVASSEHSAFRARRFKRVNPCAPSTRLFKASGGDALRIPSTVTDWLNANDELKNWLRLSVLVSAASNLEMYLGHVGRTALASDPFVRYGNSRAVDGVCLLKAGIELPYEDVIEGLTKGHWDSREAKIGTTFGVNILDVRNLKPDLEEIRKIRNEFAHGFGRSLEVPEPGVLTKSRSARLKEDKLKGYLGVISSVAKSVDRHLISNHIGLFEIIKDYHTNLEKLQTTSKEESRAIEETLKRHIYDKVGITVSRKFCVDLISHYDRCSPTLAA